MAAIAFQGVTKRFGAVPAVEDLTFDVAEGEFFCLFGPPSSGKTTVLRLILGLERPDRGEVLIGGRPAAGLTPAQRDVAMVFQNLALFPHMTAGDNVGFPLVERGASPEAITARVRDVAAKLRIAHVLHKPPAQLSGGERQRVAIARALVRDAAATLMDDPISALDARLREEARVELKRIQREAGRTFVYVTHDQEEAMSVADRMGVLEGGRLVQLGTPTELYERPTSAYVACLLGSPAMNIVPLACGKALAGAIRLDAVPPAAAEVGIRPEALQLNPSAGAPSRVLDVEPLGGSTVVTVAAPGATLRALLRGQPAFEKGAAVALSVAPGRVHFFGAGGAARRAA